MINGTGVSKAFEPRLYARSNYVWPFSSGPVYGEVDAGNWRAAGMIHTEVGTFDLTRGLPALPSERRAPLHFTSFFKSSVYRPGLAFAGLMSFLLSS